MMSSKEKGAPLLQSARREGDTVRVTVRNPRLRRPADLILLTDDGGRMLDAAFPGRPSALSRRLAGAGPTADDEALFADVGDDAALLYAVFDGEWASLGDRTSTVDIADYVDLLNAPFLARAAHPICTAAEAVALGATIEDVLKGVVGELAGRAFDVDQIEATAEDVVAGAIDIEDAVLRLAATETMATDVFGVRKAPASGWTRTRLGHVSRLASELSQASAFDVRPTLGVAQTAEEAFRTLRVAFDPALWRRDYFEKSLSDVDGDVVAFARSTDPLPLIAP